MSYLHSIPFIALPYIGSIYNSRIVQKNMNWYNSLRHSSLTPPSWVFGPVWGALYGTMGYSSYLVWRDAGNKEALLPLTLYGAQLLLNWSWVPVFFGKHKIKLGAGIILTTFGAVLGCIFAFRPINEGASNLMIPYALWLAFASFLNVRTVMLNN